MLRRARLCIAKVAIDGLQESMRTRIALFLLNTHFGVAGITAIEICSKWEQLAGDRGFARRRVSDCKRSDGVHWFAVGTAIYWSSHTTVRAVYGPINYTY